MIVIKIKNMSIYLFKQKPSNVKSESNTNTPENDEVWYEIDKNKPPHDVVLVACYTYDCGWSIDTAWWYEEKKCWMTTGSVKSYRTHLPYTHWRELPKPPRTPIGFYQ